MLADVTEYIYVNSRNIGGVYICPVSCSALHNFAHDGYIESTTVAVSQLDL